MTVLERIQPHTVEIYNLNEQNVSGGGMDARRLLHPSRFDLFAKLFYIRNRTENRALAERVYKEHIKAFNPDLTEPGNAAKSGYDAFLSVFDEMIDTFRDEEFDSARSLVPVTEDNIPLDGAHRVAALAYYGRNVGTAVCFGCRPKADFDYLYFKGRGLAWDTMDLIANEMTGYIPNLYAACLWPRIADKQQIVSLISKRFRIVYEKSLKLSFEPFKRLISIVYEGQPWTHIPESLQDKALQCYGFNRKVDFIFFTADELADVIALKDEIRALCGVGKHSVHITDNAGETQVVARSILLADERAKWAGKASNGLRERLAERWFYFRNVTLINIKVAIAGLLSRR